MHAHSASIENSANEGQDCISEGGEGGDRRVVVNGKGGGGCVVVFGVLVSFGGVRLYACAFSRLTHSFTAIHPLTHAM